MWRKWTWRDLRRRLSDRLWTALLATRVAQPVFFFFFLVIRVTCENTQNLSGTFNPRWQGSSFSLPHMHSLTRRCGESGRIYILKDLAGDLICALLSGVSCDGSFLMKKREKKPRCISNRFNNMLCVSNRDRHIGGFPLFNMKNIPLWPLLFNYSRVVSPLKQKSHSPTWILVASSHIQWFWFYPAKVNYWYFSLV